MFPEFLNENFHEFILELKENNKILSNNKDIIISDLQKLLLNAVAKRLNDKNRVGIAFSGGLDSCLLAFLCKKLGINFKLYSVGLSESKDLDNALEAALMMKWPIKFNIIPFDDVKNIIERVIAITNKRDVVNVGVGCVSYSVLKLIKEDNVNMAVTGLGSEELFAGYDKYRVKDVNEVAWNGLSNLWEKDLERDSKLASFFDINVYCPFLDKELIRCAMNVDGRLKLEGEKKALLREVALKLGLNEKLVSRKRLAGQYGSRFDYAIKKLATLNGFRDKSNYLNSL